MGLSIPFPINMIKTKVFDSESTSKVYFKSPIVAYPE